MTVRFDCRDHQAILSIQGRFDFSVHTDFRRRSEQALETEGVRQIVVDLTQVDYLDSSALGMLLLLREKAANAGRVQVVLTGARSMVRQVLDVANFGRLFPID